MERIRTSRYCSSCGYSLDHVTKSACPECGREFDPGNSWTWRNDSYGRNTSKAKVRAWVAGIGAVVIVVAIGAAAAAFFPGELHVVVGVMFGAAAIIAFVFSLTDWFEILRPDQGVAGQIRSRASEKEFAQIIGQLGIVDQAMRPVGTFKMGVDRHTARACSGAIDIGERVRVVARERGMFVVERVDSKTS